MKVREFIDFSIQPGKNMVLSAEFFFFLLVSLFELNVEVDELCLLLRVVNVSLHL